MDAGLEELVSSLLYEGYALYPYTPGATKNATPTPFGIVYPPAYAEHNPSTVDHLRIECILEADPEAMLEGTVRFCKRPASATRESSASSAFRPAHSPSWAPRESAGSSASRASRRFKDGSGSGPRRSSSPGSPGS